jgi:hypothetical protein
VWVLDLTAPLTFFWSASALVKQQGRHGYASFPALSNRRLVGWLAVDAPKARRTASVCAGAFLMLKPVIRAWWARKSAFDSRAAGLSIF